MNGIEMTGAEAVALGRAAIHSPSRLILLGSGLGVPSILAGLLARRVGAPILLVFLCLGMLVGEDGASHGRRRLRAAVVTKEIAGCAAFGLVGGWALAWLLQRLPIEPALAPLLATMVRLWRDYPCTLLDGRSARRTSSRAPYRR
jgi:NhaP-type Na+/H+ and K+/H+ antiporter